MAPRGARGRFGNRRRRLFRSTGRERSRVRGGCAMTKPPKQIAGSEIRVIERAPLPAMRMIGATTTDAPATLRWTLMLVWFMRTMAVVWIAKGLFAWTIVLGVNRVVADLLELPVLMQAMVSFFAVADLMAAVGLWLAGPRGG